MNPQLIRNHVASLQPGFWGKFFYHCLPLRKRIVLANLQYVFGNVLSQQEIKKLAQCFYLHFFRTLGENIAMRFMSEQQVCDQAVVVGKEIPLKVAEQNKGMAILTAHIGNWELAPIAGILNFKQFQGRFHFIRRNQIKIVEHIFFRRFHRAGLQIIPNKNSLDQICDVLAQKDAVIFIADKHAFSKKDSDFYGKKARTRSLATIIGYTDTPVIPALTYRRADGKHVLQFCEPITWIKCENQQDEIRTNAKAYNEAIEKMILSHPEQWFWLVRRPFLKA